MSSFADLGVSARGGALAAHGIHKPFAIQRLVIGDVLAGRDVLAKSPTGSGKTLAFAVPLVDRIEPSRRRAPPALVLAPTRELAAQIVEDARAASPAPAASRSPPSTAASASTSRSAPPAAPTCSWRRPAGSRT